MATFYILPPRACLEDLFASMLGRLLPGLPMPADGWDLMLVQLAANSGWSRDLYLVTRDELPEEGRLEDALRVHFGAEPGDRVVEVPLAKVALERQGTVRSWTVPPVGVSITPGSFYNPLIPELPSANVLDAS